jgi:recombinational DNA repair protein (RecF pathway)
MTAAILHHGFSRCTACARPFPTKQKGGEVRLSLTAKSGPSVSFGGPICSACGAKVSANPEAALALLRKAAPEILASHEGESF